MELTLIKVPGKRKKKRSKDDTVARKAVVCSLLIYIQSGLIQIQNRRAGGRLKPPKAVSTVIDSPSSTAKEPKKRSLKHLKSRRKMSLLEKLPTELLETIFLHSLNFELPRSSPVLGGKLSSNLIYTRILMAVFGPTWNEWHGVQRNRRTQADSSGADPKIQARLLLLSVFIY
jgi:hypothetical protein